MSIQILSKVGRKNRLVKTVGCAKTAREEELLLMLGKTEMARLQGMQSLFIEHDDLVVESFVNSISTDHLQIVGSELILGKIYDKIGFPADGFVLVKMDNIPHNDVPLWMNASDVILLSSLWEGSPNVIKEAMACNRPIVSTKVGDVEWLFGNETGHFIANFDAQDYATQLNLAIAYAREFGSTQGRQRIIQLGLDSKTVARQIVEIYKKTIEKK